MSKPVCYMGTYNEHDIRDMHTVVVRYVTDFKSNPDRVIPLYEHPPVPTTERRVPDGWKLVPIEPTHLMERAGHEAEADSLGIAAQIYRAMINAAPAKEME